MDKLDYAILNFLTTNQATSKMKAKTRTDMLDNLDMGKHTLYRRIVKLISKRYVERGFTEGQQHAYFITETGTIKLQEAMGQ